ncbi:MAG: T9SS type A sorting domain-containing protein [Candidatus Caldipriscus sp.]
MKGNLLHTIALWVRGLMLALLSVSLVAIFTEYAHAQVRFARTYGGTSYEHAYSVQQTSDGGYIVAGFTNSFGAGGWDAFLIKTDAYGNVQWTKTYGGWNQDEARSVQQTSDGGYIVAGYTHSFGAGADDFFLFKTDAFGNVQWAKTYGGWHHDYAYSVQQTSDGGYIVAGYTLSYGSMSGYDVLLIKTDANGNLQWAKTYRGTSGDYAFSIRQTSDGGYIVAGGGYSFDVGGDAFLIKTDAFGNVQWAKTYGGLGEDVAYSVQQTSDGGYIVAGYTESFGPGGYALFLIKTNAFGNVQWAKTYGGTSWDIAHSVQQTSDGGYIVAGYTGSFGAGGDDILLIKTAANGNVIWAKTYGGTGYDYAYSVQQTSDGGYIVAGHTIFSFSTSDYDIFLIKTDANGNIGSCGIVRNVTPPVTTPSVTVITPSFSVSSPSPAVNSPSPTVTSPTLTVTAPCPLSDDNVLGISESCKPVSGIITPYKGGIKVSGSGEFEVKVYNVSGVVVKSVKGKDEVKLELSRGVYFVEVVSGGKVIREKVVIR